jgi:hypothetical protein
LWTADVLTAGATGLGHIAAEKNMQQEEARNAKNTEKMAEALAKGLVMQDEDGSWQATAGSEEELKAIGLSIEETNRFAAELGDGAEELREYGQQVQLRKEQEKAMYDAMATNAQQLVDTSKMSKEAQNMIGSVTNADYMAGFKEQALAQIDEEENFENKYDWYDWV